MLTLIRIVLLFISGARRISNSRSAARGGQLIKKLQERPGETPDLIRSLVQRCSYVNEDQISDWSVQIHKIPETFSMQNFHCLYRQFEGNGVLMIVRCDAQDLQGTMRGAMHVNVVYTFVFYARYSKFSGNYEVITESYNDIIEKNLQSTFGWKFFEAVKGL